MILAGPSRSRLISLSLCGLAFAWCRSAEAAPADADRIVRIWQQNGVNVRTFDLEWRAEEFRAAGSEGPVGGKHVPLEDVTVESTGRIAVDGDGRVRLETDGVTWSRNEDEYVRQHAIDIFNGQDRHLFFAEGSSEFPSAHISESSPSGVANDLRVYPILLALRPFDSRLGVFKRQEVRASGNTVVNDGRPCDVLYHQSGTLWIDPARGHLPVRYLIAANGATTIEVQITYEPVDGIFLPAGWETTRFLENGDVSATVEAVVSKRSINPPFGPEVFSVEYPPGTWVRNYKTNERYILREAGDKRPVLKGEYDGTNYTALLNSEPRQATVDEGLGLWKIVAILGAAMLLTAGGIALFRRMRATP